MALFTITYNHALVLWYSPKQYNTFVTNLLCFTKNAIKFDYQYN